MHFWRLFWTAAKRWYTSDASRWSAALAYFTPFALVPLILISVTVVGRVTDEALFAELLRSWGEVLGLGATEVLAGAVQNFDPAAAYYNIPLLAIIFLGAMVVFTFNNLAAGLRAIWGVSQAGVWQGIETAVRSLLFFVLLQAFFVTVFVIEIVIPWILTMEWVVALQRLFLFMAMIALFTFGYRVLTWEAPSLLARLSGALVTGIIFIFMRTIVEWWLFFTPAVEQYGGAGIIFGLLIWIYITAMVIFYGAAFAWAFDHERLAKWQRRS